MVPTVRVAVALQLVPYATESPSLFRFRTINESGPRCVVELAALQRTAVCTPDICACFIEHPLFDNDEIDEG